MGVIHSEPTRITIFCTKKINPPTTRKNPITQSSPRRKSVDFDVLLFFFPGGSSEAKSKARVSKVFQGENWCFSDFFCPDFNDEIFSKQKNPNKNQSPLRLPPGNQPKIQIYERISFAKSWLLINDPCNDLGKLRHYNSAT